MAVQHLQQGGIKSRAIGIVLAAHHTAFYASLRRTLQRIDAGLGRYHQRDAAIGVFPRAWLSSSA